MRNYIEVPSRIYTDAPMCILTAHIVYVIPARGFSTSSGAGVEIKLSTGITVESSISYDEIVRLLSV